MATTIERMGEQMKARLTELERDVSAGLHAFVRVGKALREIRDQHLYRLDYNTFDQYVAHRWEMSRSYAYRLIDAADIAETIQDIGNAEPPRHESHARALMPLKEDRQAVVSVWRALREEHGAELTAETVHQAVRAQLARIDAEPRAQTPEPPLTAQTASAKPVTSNTHPQAEVVVSASLGASQAGEILEWIDGHREVPGAVADFRQQIEVQLRTLT